jgi:hypothetical protein
LQKLEFMTVFGVRGDQPVSVANHATALPETCHPLIVGRVATMPHLGI